MTDSDVFTSADVAQMVENLSTRLRSRRKAAEAMMVNSSYLSNVISGESEPGPAITDYFGLRKERKGIFVSVLGAGDEEPERDIIEELHQERVKRVRDPMKMLHLDYCLDKLAGKVVIPKGRGKKINLQGDTLSIYD